MHAYANTWYEFSFYECMSMLMLIMTFFFTFTLYGHKNADTCYVLFFLTLIMMCDNAVMFISSMYDE